MASKVRVSTGRLVLGVIAGWLLAIGAAFWLLLLPTFDERTRIEILDEVASVHTPVIRNQKALELVLRGEQVRFRVWERIFAEALRGQVPPGLVPGAKVRATVEKDEYDEPRSPAPYRVPTVTVDALDVDGTSVLTLGDSRRWETGNRKVIGVMAPIFVVVAAYLSLMLARRLREERTASSRR